MSRRHVRHFYAVFDHFSKVNKIMRAYMVPPYGIRWEGTRKKNYLKDFQRILSRYENNVPASCGVLNQALRFCGFCCLEGLPTRLSCTRCEVCIVQGIDCVLYKYAMCIVQGVQIVLYRVYSVYYTGCAVCILHQNLAREKRTLISNMILSNIINF